MSSHHFVRDKQEPALIIANGDECSNEVLNQLLEWNPFVLVLDGALDRVLMKGIKVDAVIGDFDSLNVNRLSVEDEQQIDWIVIEDQETTDLEKGIKYLLDTGHKAANIVWATGKRLDHSHNNLITVAKYGSNMPICIIDDYSKAYMLPSKPAKFAKYFSAESIISLIPMTDVRGIETTGLKFNLHQEDFIIPQRTGSSNEAETDGIIEIQFDSGILFLMECFD
ncbi:MAG: thiamine diphosphokinase [Bacteroidetes bacterium]|jgi:thiamine pyrophosphokinase|nr:thiamine diphosphokinase [Bacteroidota bacterium]